MDRWPRQICARFKRWIRTQTYKIQLGLRGIWTSCTPQRRPTDQEKDHASDYPGSDAHSRPPSDFDAGPIPEVVMFGPGSPSRTYEQRAIPPYGSTMSLSMHNGVSNISGHNFNGSPPSIQQALLHVPTAPGAVLSQTQTPAPEDEERPKPMRLKSFVERVIAMNKTAGDMAAFATRARTELDIVSGSHDSGNNDGTTSHAYNARIHNLRPGVTGLQVTQCLNEHIALVTHMQFSPQGDFLATCSWDRTAVIWRISKTNVEMFLKLYHPSSTGSFVNQVVWSPDGSMLLTRTQKGLKVWDAVTGAGQKEISRPRLIKSTVWMPKGGGILSVEYKQLQRRARDIPPVTDTCLVCLDLNGTVLDSHTLSRIQIWDAAVMADETRVVAVGTLLKTLDQLQPTKSRAEKRLLVYNLKTREIEHHVPLLQDVRNITLSNHTPKSAYALVSCESKTPPEMWRIELKTGIKQGEAVARLVLVQCGEVFIWDRTSTALLHTMQPGNGEVIKSFACNREGAPDFMLVTGALDGTIRIRSSGERFATS
ncbi:hypothetical protein FRC07_001769 [Ceratobasidium sp. 392]|nr:hypothetical protein FRC07_001769 [Ceratobasidium sp. 392]